MRISLFFVLLLFSFVLVSCSPNRVLILPDGASKSYGFVWFSNEVARTLVVGSAGTYVPINFSDGCSSLNMGCDSWNVSVERSGDYAVGYHSSFSDGGNNEFHLTVGLDGVGESDKCHSSRKLGNTGDIGSMSGHCILPLVSGEVVSVMVENAGAGNDIKIKDFSLSVVKI